MVPESTGFFCPVGSNFGSKWVSDESQISHCDNGNVLTENLNTLKMFHLNVQCLSNKINMLSMTLDRLKSDIVCISEHWYDNHTLSGVNIQGYTLQASFCRRAGLHGGVAIYARDGRVCKDVNLNSFSVPFHAEFAGVEITELNCLVVAVYRSSRNGKFSIFSEQLEIMLDEMFVRFDRIVLLGDFNCDPDRHPADSHKLSCIMATYDLRQTICDYTRVTRQTKSRLDNIYINFHHGRYHSNTYDPGISDHSGQTIVIECEHSVMQGQVRNQMGRVMTASGLVRLKVMLGTFNWDSLGLPLLDENAAMNSFIEAVCSGMSECAVLKASVRSNTRSSIVPWFNDSLRTMRDRLTALRTVCCVTNSDSDWRAYRAYRGEYRHSLAEAKRLSYSRFIENADNVQKNCWKVINSLRSNKRPVGRYDTTFSAEEFNNHFASAADKVLSGLPVPSPAHHCLSGGLPANPKTMFLSPVSRLELAETILHLRDTKSLDYYGMNPRLLKHICDEVAEPLTAIINRCFTEGVFPQSLKINKIVPIHKKKGFHNLDNYRPIAISPVITKVIEIILKKRLLEFFNASKVLCAQQFAFRAGLSTTDAVLRLLEDVVNGFDAGLRTEVTLCDLTKAFDCVSVPILLDKLYSCGVRGVCYSLLSSYLRDRQQYVAVSGVQSGLLPQSHGVPQGSVLGPLLFLIYINDLPAHVDKASAIIFADDTTLYTRGHTIDEARVGMLDAVEQASLWFSCNSLLLNEDKTQRISLTTDKNAPAQKAVSLLGFKIDQRLTWASQVDQVCAKASSGIYVLRNLVPLVADKVLRLAYFSLVQSHLNYGVILWGGSSESHRAFVVQKKAVRVMVRKGAREHCGNWFRYLGILTLPSLYVYASCLHTHKVASSMRRHADVHDYNTRSRELLLVPASRTCCSQNNKVDVNLYNALPGDMKKLTFALFKRTLRRFLIDRAFYSVDEFLNHDR